MNNVTDKSNTENTRGFKGIWIPKQIWLSTDLSIIEKVVLVDLDSLDNSEKGCFASNAYLANFFQVSIRQIQRVISSLTSKGLISSTLTYVKGTKQVDKRYIKVNQLAVQNLTHKESETLPKRGHSKNADTPTQEVATPANTGLSQNGSTEETENLTPRQKCHHPHDKSDVDIVKNYNKENTILTAEPTPKFSEVKEPAKATNQPKKLDKGQIEQADIVTSQFSKAFYADIVKQLTNIKNGSLSVSEAYTELSRIGGCPTNYTMSGKDGDLISKLKYYTVDVDVLTEKIITNIVYIALGHKAKRFGNLFVGLDQINSTSENFTFNK